MWPLKNPPVPLFEAPQTEGMVTRKDIRSDVSNSATSRNSFLNTIDGNVAKATIIHLEECRTIKKPSAKAAMEWLVQTNTRIGDRVSFEVRERKTVHVHQDSHQVLIGGPVQVLM